MKHQNHQKITALIILTTLLLLNGCLYSRIHPAGMEPCSSPLKNLNYEIMGQAQGQASNFSLFWLVTVTPHADIERAISEAVSKKNGDTLIDVRWWIEKKIYIIGTVTIIHVKGRVIRYR